MSSDTTIITLLDNGPYIIRGGAKVVDAAGHEFADRETIALCRCGQSGNRPFCDGAHARAAFKDESRA